MESKNFNLFSQISMNVNLALVKTVEHVVTAVMDTIAHVPLDIQERVVKLVSTYCL